MEPPDQFEWKYLEQGPGVRRVSITENKLSSH